MKGRGGGGGGSERWSGMLRWTFGIFCERFAFLLLAYFRIHLISLSEDPALVHEESSSSKQASEH